MCDEGFTLEFLFAPNKFFSNSVLTKEYLMKFDVDKDAPLEYDGPEIVKCKGSVSMHTICLNRASSIIMAGCLRGSVVERQSLVSVLWPSCAQPVADG